MEADNELREGTEDNQIFIPKTYAALRKVCTSMLKDNLCLHTDAFLFVRWCFAVPPYWSMY